MSCRSVDCAPCVPARCQAHVDAAVANGSTLLYDALAKAQEQLDVIGEQFPKCHKRILCLTDGEDTGSSSSPEVIAAALQSSKVVVDTVLIGPSNNVAKAISVATGGCCFVPANVQEAQVSCFLGLSRSLTCSLAPCHVMSRRR